MNAKRAFIVGAIVGTAVVSLVSWILSDAENATSPTQESNKKGTAAPNSIVEPEPNPLKLSLIHQAQLPKKYLLRDLRNASLDAEKIRIIKSIGHSRLKSATTDLGAIAESERGPLQRAAIDALGRLGGTHAVDILIGLSEANLQAVRDQALDALGQMGSPVAIDWLKEVAQSNLLRMSNQALHAIAKGGDDSQVSYFVRMMNDTNVEIAVSAAQALASLGTHRSQQTLILMAQREETGAVRLAAIRGLGHFDNPEVRRLVEKLVFDERGQVAKAAIESYAQMNAPNVVQTLSELAQTGRRSLQRPATRALGTIGSIEARDELINILFTEENQTMLDAALALATIGDDESIEALADGLKGGLSLTSYVLSAMEKAPTNDTLIESVSDVLLRNKNELSVDAGRVLAVHLGSKAVPDIVAALGKLHSHQQSRLCKVLARIDGEVSKRALLDLVHTADENLRINALEALIENDRLRPTLAQDLAIKELNKTKSFGVFRQLLNILAALDEPTSDEHLMTLLASSKNTRDHINEFRVREIILAISSKGSAHLLSDVIDYIRQVPAGRSRQDMLSSLHLDRPDSREFLREIASGTGSEAATILARFARQSPHEVRDIAYNAINSDDAAMRLSGMRVLHGINGTEEINALGDLLKDNEPSVKFKAVHALGQNNDSHSMNLLIDAFEGEDESIRGAAAIHIADSGHPRALDVLVKATLSSGPNSRSFFHIIEGMNTPESKQAIQTIKENAPSDNEHLQADILNSELAQEEEDLFKGFHGKPTFLGEIRSYRIH